MLTGNQDKDIPLTDVSFLKHLVFKSSCSYMASMRDHIVDISYDSRQVIFDIIKNYLTGIRQVKYNCELCMRISDGAFCPKCSVVMARIVSGECIGEVIVDAGIIIKLRVVHFERKYVYTYSDGIYSKWSLGTSLVSERNLYDYIYGVNDIYDGYNACWHDCDYHETYRTCLINGKRFAYNCISQFDAFRQYLSGVYLMLRDTLNDDVAGVIIRAIVGFYDAIYAEMVGF